jgi:hypothetical protein
MPVLETLVGGGIFALFGKVVDRIWPDPVERDKAKVALLEMQQKGELAELDAELQTMLAQAAINLEDAKSENIWKSGARPAILWVCAASLAYNFLLYPILTWAITIWPTLVYPPRFESGLMELTLGMLGLAGMRSFDKLKGLTK